MHTDKVNILLVDDDPKNLLALTAMLDDMGENLVTASSGRDALKCLLMQDFALILLDVQMPEMDGFETAALIRRRKKSRHIPIVFITAFTPTDAQVFQGYAIGAVDFLFKPVVRDVLRSKVSVFVELFRKTEEVQRQERLLREAEQRQHEQELLETRRSLEAKLLREEMENERRIAEAQALRADELERSIAERERAEEALRRSNDRLALLAETANRLLLGPKPEQFIDEVYRQLSLHLDLEVYLSYLVHEDGKMLRLGSYKGLPEDLAREREWLPFGDSVCGVVAAKRRPIISEEGMGAGGAASFPFDDGVTAFACFPLLADGRLFGTLAFGTRRRSCFREDELQVMRVVCDQAAMAMERARLITELQERAGALAETDRRKDEFLAMLAHELRNPLAPMLNAVHLLRLRGEREDGAERQAIDAMWRQIHHMIRLVDDLLDVSRITSGKIYLKREPARLDQVVEHAIQTSRPLIESRQQKLSVSLPPEPIWLMADFTRLAQVIANLLNNAAKYTDEGGSVWLTAAREGATVVLRVRDTGIGLSREMLSRVFDLFVQAERGVARSQGGLGLGLTLVRTLVEMHSGSASASSEGIGRGSEFVVRLPIDDAASLAAARTQDTNGAGAAAERPRRPKASLRVLVVDDNGDIRETLKDLLELCGHEVHVAEDGMSATELTLSLRPDVALIDIGLPGLDGYQVAAKLRTEMRGNRRTRLIALTGYGQAEDRLRALEAGFDAHLVKPVDFDRLTELLADPGLCS